MDANKRLLTSAEAAELLTISERKLWGLTESGEIKVTMIPPRSKRYDIADLLDFINHCKRNGRSAEAVHATHTKS